MSSDGTGDMARVEKELLARWPESRLEPSLPRRDGPAPAPASAPPPSTTPPPDRGLVDRVVEGVGGLGSLLGGGGR